MINIQSSFKPSVLSLLVVSLMGCASVIETPNQSVEIVTLGASEALCDVKIGNSIYQAEAPQTIHVKKSEHPIEVSCMASGNREKSVSFDAEISELAPANALSAGVGAAYDYASGALFVYPEKIVVDFRDVPMSRYSLPDYELLNRTVGHDQREIERMGADVPETDSSINRQVRSGWVGERYRRSSSVDTGYKAQGYNNYAPQAGESVPEVASPYFPEATFPGTTSF